MPSDPPRRYCVFCEIVAGREPATFYYQDDRAVVFKNILNWVPTMLLVVPREHYRQDELWTTPELVGYLGKVAAFVGAEHCPRGFRILSNFGPDGLQSQEHGHIHVLGGVNLGPYA